MKICVQLTPAEARMLEEAAWRLEDDEGHEYTAREVNALDRARVKLTKAIDEHKATKEKAK